MTNQPTGTPDVRRPLKYDDQYSDTFPKKYLKKSYKPNPLGLTPCSLRSGNYLIAVISLKEFMWETTAIAHAHLSSERKELIKPKKTKKTKQCDPQRTGREKTTEKKIIPMDLLID